MWHLSTTDSDWKLGYEEMNRIKNIYNIIKENHCNLTQIQQKTYFLTINFLSHKLHWKLNWKYSDALDFPSFTNLIFSATDSKIPYFVISSYNSRRAITLAPFFVLGI